MAHWGVSPWFGQGSKEPLKRGCFEWELEEACVEKDIISDSHKGILHMKDEQLTCSPNRVAHATPGSLGFPILNSSRKGWILGLGSDSKCR